MPEFYGWIKSIRQRDITIQKVSIDLYRGFREIANEEEKMYDQYWKAFDEWKKTMEGKPPETPFRGGKSPASVLRNALHEGPKVTLNCANAYLIDKAIELIRDKYYVICKFEVKEGQIVKIEKAEV